MSKRIVLHHTTGAYAGLWQILGTDDQLMEKFKTASLPEYVAEVEFIDHKGSCSLISVKSRYVLYREVGPGPVTGMLGQFHPHQQ